SRPLEENHLVFNKVYGRQDATGSIPRKVLERWRKDVGERRHRAIDAACVSNCFVIHRRHMDFIRRWGEQIKKVIPPDVNTIIDPTSVAYAMTDESVLNSLLAFSELAPPRSEFQLDQDENAFVAHFGLSPKPWNRWQYSHLKFFDYIME